MSKEPRKIDNATYLKAVGLFTIGQEHMKQFLQIEKVLNELLGFDPHDPMSNQIADALWGAGPETIDDALKNEKIKVSK